MNQSPQTAPYPNQHQCPWETMGLSSRLSCVMSIFPRRLWGYIITEPMFSPEEMYEVDAYFGYSRRYRNLQPRTYWDQSSSSQPGCFNDPRFQLPQVSFVHHVVNHHNVNIVAHQYKKGEDEPLSPISPKTRDRESTPDITNDTPKFEDKASKQASSTRIEPLKRKDRETSRSHEVKEEEKQEEHELDTGKRVKLEQECKQESVEPCSAGKVETVAP